jgi:4-hydroxy-tetrahydrodipicolinate synthase
MNNVPNDRTVIVGIGGSISSVLQMVECAVSFGTPGIMVMYPRHVFSSEEGLLNYYSQILNAAKDLGVVLYKKGELFTDQLVKKLLHFDNLIAIKYAFGRIVDFTRSVQSIGKRIVWSCGTAERFAPFYWLAGAEGFTSGLGNFAPQISLQMLDALRNNNYDKAMKIQKMITPLEDLREGRNKANNVPVIKAVMDSIGLDGGECRPPIHALTDEERETVIEAVSSWIN